MYLYVLFSILNFFVYIHFVGVKNKNCVVFACLKNGNVCTA